MTGQVVQNDDYNATAKSIDERAAVIRYALSVAASIGDGISWRDVVPPEFLTPSTVFNFGGVNVNSNGQCQIGSNTGGVHQNLPRNA